MLLRILGAGFGFWFPPLNAEGAPIPPTLRDKDQPERWRTEPGESVLFTVRPLCAAHREAFRAARVKRSRLGLFLVSVMMRTGAAAPIAHAQRSCDWTLTASSPAAVVSQGSQAIYMQGAGGVILFLSTTGTAYTTTGSLLVSDFQGLGTYAVGVSAKEGREGSGATFMIQPPEGGFLTLAAGDGSEVVDKGEIIGTLPPPSRLTITWHEAGEIRGDLSGTFYDMTALGSNPRRVVLVPVHIVFTARPGCR